MKKVKMPDLTQSIENMKPFASCDFFLFFGEYTSDY